MSDAARIADEIRRSYYGDAWHGPSLIELLEGVSSAAAQAKPLAGAHSIWEIVLHITTWVNLAAGAIEGKPIPPWPFPEDWPAVEGEWAEALKRLKAAIDGLVWSAGSLGDERLEATVPGRDHVFRFLLSGIVQHNAYHGGQIAALKHGAHS